MSNLPERYPNPVLRHFGTKLYDIASTTSIVDTFEKWLIAFLGVLWGQLNRVAARSRSCGKA